MKNKVCGPEGCLHENEAGSTGRGMRNKVYQGPKDICMRIKLGQRDVVFARKNGMKNNVCGPERRLY